MLLALDPGTKCVGWAVWSDRLYRCGLVRTKEKTTGQQGWDLRLGLLDVVGPVGLDVLVEVPRIYPYNRKMQPNDLIDLAFVAGAVSTVGQSVETVLPVDWKGQTPKDVCHERLLARLSRDELLVVQAGVAGVPESLQHNVLDAIGIGRWKITGEKL
jgi:hypothetical protein